MEHPFTGLTACLKLGTGDSAKVLAYVSGVDLSLEKEIIEILAFGKQYKEKVPSIKDWSASIDGTVALAKSGTQRELYDAFESGALLTVGIYLDEATYFEGTGYVSSFDISAAPDDKISLTSEIAGSGGVTLTLPDTLVVSPTSLSVSEGATGTVSATLASGATIREVHSSDGAIASVTFSGSTVTVEGVGKGTCYVTIEDSLGNVAEVSVTVT